MSNFSRDNMARAPSHDEMQRILARARQMRAETLRRLAVSGWTMLRRSVTRRHPAGSARHA